MAFAYAVLIECFITRDIHPVRDLPRVLVDAGRAVRIGAHPARDAPWASPAGWSTPRSRTRCWQLVKAHITSPHVFLLVLNGVLLRARQRARDLLGDHHPGAARSRPIGAAFGIDPVHLGVVFLANLELGFLFPPAGLNLFLSSSRFSKPLPKLYRDVRAVPGHPGGRRCW